MSNQITAYLSHSIRGIYREKATHEQMKENCQKALDAAKEIRAMFPNLDLYVPAEHEDFVELSYTKKYLTEEQILDIDCSIISKKNLLVVYSSDSFISNGMWVEINFAVRHNIPIVLLKDVDELQPLNVALNSFMK